MSVLFVRTSVTRREVCAAVALVLFSLSTPLWAASAAAVDFVLAYQRQGLLQPRDCDAEPNGGLAREARMLQREFAGRIVWPVSAGATFVPPSGQFNSKFLDRFREKAAVMARALQLLGTKAVALGAEDALLGAKTLGQLAKSVPLLGANWKAPKNAGIIPFLDLSESDIRLVGLADPGGLWYAQAPAGFRWSPPREVLAKIVAESTGRRIVVLSDLRHSELENLSAAFPTIELWLGGEVTAADVALVEQPSATQMWVSTPALGEDVVHVRWPSGTGPLRTAQLFSRQERILSAIRQIPESDRSEADRKAFDVVAAVVEAREARRDVQVTRLRLSPKFEGETNAIATAIEEWKSRWQKRRWPLER